MTKEHVAIVGAGIVGLAHAWSAAERGHHVIVLERTGQAEGGSVRNFGMVWPIGQASPEHYQTALMSRKRWSRIAQEAGIWINPCGSIHLAHRADEWSVLQEFAERGPKLGFECELLSAEQVQQRTPGANPDRLLGGLFSPTEMCVNPPATIRAIPKFLYERYGVEFHFRTTAVEADTGYVSSADGRRWDVDRVVVCSGTDFETLFPDHFINATLRKCKLQMMRTIAQPDQWRLGPHIASGLTLRHYRSFEICPSLNALRERVAKETPELDRFGIHVMASQNNLGEVILGDSHEYGNDIEPFDKALIDELILRELRKILRLPEWQIGERWHGLYAKCSDSPKYELEPRPRVHIFSGVGGTGMTMSFGLAEQRWQTWST